MGRVASDQGEPRGAKGMSKAAFTQIADGLSAGLALTIRAKRLYVEAGNLLEDWPIVDEWVRTYFLIAAAEMEDEPRSLH